MIHIRVLGEPENEATFRFLGGSGDETNCK